MAQVTNYGQPETRPRRRQGSPLTLSFVLAIIFNATVCGFFKPLDVERALIMACVVALPLSIIPAYLFVRFLQAKNRLGWLNTRYRQIAFSLILACATPCTLFVMNTVFDTGSPVSTLSSIVGKNIVHGKQRDAYWAYVPTPVPAGLPAERNKTVGIRLSGLAQYNAIRPGIDHALIVTKPGFLGFPWIVSETVMPPAAIHTGSTPQ